VLSQNTITFSKHLPKDTGAISVNKNAWFDLWLVMKIQY